MLTSVKVIVEFGIRGLSPEKRSLTGSLRARKRVVREKTVIDGQSQSPKKDSAGKNGHRQGVSEPEKG